MVQTGLVRITPVQLCSIEGGWGVNPPAAAARQREQIAVRLLLCPSAHFRYEKFGCWSSEQALTTLGCPWVALRSWGKVFLQALAWPCVLSSP